MKHTILNYALSYIDVSGKEVLISSNGEEITLEGKPFYVSRENAAKKQKNIVNNIYQDISTGMIKLWMQHQKN